MIQYHFVRPDARETAWEVRLTAASAHLLTALARDEMQVVNGPQEALVDVRPGGGLFTGYFRFVSEIGVAFFVGRCEGYDVVVGPVGRRR